MKQIAMTNRRRLMEVADRGYVTVQAAEKAGVQALDLRKLASRGWLDRVAHGVYRFVDAVVDDNSSYYEAVLSVGPESYLTRESVLAFHDLAHVNPRRIKVGTARRVRRSVPDHIQIIRDNVPDAERTVYDGVPSATVERAIRDSIGTVMEDRLLDAVEQARKQGLIRRKVQEDLRDEIGAVR